MSACPIKTYVDAILVAYGEICSNCCATPAPCSSPANTSTLCGDGQGLLWEIRTAVLGMLATTPEGCNPLTALAPDPGELTTCVTEAYLQGMLAWLQGVTCQPCPPEDCFCVRYQYRETPTSYPTCEQQAELSSEYPADYYEACSYANTELGFRLYWDTDESAWMLSFTNCIALGGTPVILNVGETRTDPRRALSDATGGYWVEITDCPCEPITDECTPSICWTIEEYYNTSEGVWQDLTVTGEAGSCYYEGYGSYILAWSDDDGCWSIYYTTLNIKWLGDSADKSDPRGMYAIVGENPDPTQFRNTLLCVGICEAECAEELARCNSYQVPSTIDISFSCGAGDMTWGRPDYYSWPNCREFTAPKPYGSGVAVRSGARYDTQIYYTLFDPSWYLSWQAVVRLVFDRVSLSCKWVCDIHISLASSERSEWAIDMYHMPLVVTTSCDPHGVVSDTWVFADGFDCQPSPISGELTIVT